MMRWYRQNPDLYAGKNITFEFRERKPTQIPHWYRNYTPAPPRVPTSHLANRTPEDLRDPDEKHVDLPPVHWRAYAT